MSILHSQQHIPRGKRFDKPDVAAKPSETNNLIRNSRTRLVPTKLARLPPLHLKAANEQQKRLSRHPNSPGTFHIKPKHYKNVR